MKPCADCQRDFEPREPYHKYCQALPAEPCYARRQGWATRPRRPKGVPWHPSWDWMLQGDLIVWVMLIALPAIVLYAVGRLLGFW